VTRWKKGNPKKASLNGVSQAENFLNQPQFRKASFSSGKDRCNLFHAQ
jgi:hypothetical protein